MRAGHYGAFAYLRSSEDTGRYVIQTSVRKDVTAAAIDEILDADEMITVVVGDRDEILADLETLGRPVIELDRQARPASH